MEEGLKLGSVDAVLVFDENFDQSIIEKTGVPAVKIYYNPTENNSAETYNKLYVLIDTQKAKLLEDLEIDPNIFLASLEEVFDEKKAAGSFLGMLLPLLLVSFIFAGAMSIGADAVAGEKERGTLATLLMAPLKRDEIILGKIVSTTIINFCYAASSFIGIIGALPFMKSLVGSGGAVISYGVPDYLGLLGIIIVLSVFASTILLVTSTIAKTVKEASMYAMPIHDRNVVADVHVVFSGENGNAPRLYHPGL